MSLVDEAAREAEAVFGITGIPWGTPGFEDYFAFDPEFGYRWRQVLLDKMMAASNAIGQTDITRDEILSLDFDEARTAFATINQAFFGVAGDALDAIKKGDISRIVLGLNGATVRQFLIAVYAYVRTGANLQWEGVFERAIDDGRISLRDAEAHADGVARVLDTIVAMQEAGLFTGLGRSTSGVGAPWWYFLAAAALVLGFILISQIVANYAQIQQAALDQCAEYLKKELYEEHQQCLEARGKENNEGVNDMIGKIMQPLTFAAWVMGIGAVLYIGTTLVLPALKMLPKPKAAGAASA